MTYTPAQIADHIARRVAAVGEDSPDVQIIRQLMGERDRMREALIECREEIDACIQHEYPLDHPVQERCRQRDYAANPARIALAALTTQEQAHD